MFRWRDFLTMCYAVGRLQLIATAKDKSRGQTWLLPSNDDVVLSCEVSYKYTHIQTCRRALKYSHGKVAEREDPFLINFLKILMCVCVGINTHAETHTYICLYICTHLYK